MSTATPTTDLPEPMQEIDLIIGGMTCASCSSRVERKLNRMEGVQATVNLATERAHVVFGAGVSAQDLIATVEKTGYTASPLADTAEAAGETDDGSGGGAWRGWFTDPSLARRALVSAVLAVPVVVIAMVPAVHHAFGGARPWVELALSLPVVVWAAFPFHRAALVNARHGSSTMDTLVSLGVLASFGWSLVATLAGSAEHLYYESAVVITTFLLLGRTAEARAKHRGRSALQTLLELGAKEVSLVEDGPDGEVERRAPVGELAVGSRFRVRPGEKVATDGVVLSGRSAIDAGLVTGESLPIDVAPGDEVTGGTINTDGVLLVRAERVGAETTLAGITRLVEAAQTGKAPVQRLADRVSSVFVPTVLALSVVTFLGWIVTGHAAAQALSAAVAVLIIACPCALGLATPTALLVGTGRGAELGVLIKGPEILESTRRVDTVVLDKTGTVTLGSMRLMHIAPSGRLTSTSAVQAAAAVEAGSEHPVATAIVQAARERGLQIPVAEHFVNLPGAGARATIKGTEVTVGRADLFEQVPADIREVAAEGTTVYVGWGGLARAALTVADELRPTSGAAIARLGELGLTTYLLTGDNEATARAVAQQVGIPAAHVVAQVRPEEKHAAVAWLRAQGKVVAMVGDGVNDAAALAEADLGIAMGSGTDVAIGSADVVLMRPDVGAVADAIGLSRRTLRIIQENLVWAFGYNVAALPLAAFGLLNPMIAGGAMAASSVLVVVNSLRLRGFARRP